MELEQYLEKDILTFLDSKILKKENVSIDREEEYGLYMTKDYLKELTTALDNDELTRAKKLFDELKTNHSRLPKTSIERKRVYALLEKMYEKIQDYVEIKEGKIEIIKEGDSEVRKNRKDKFTDLNDRMKGDEERYSEVKLDFDFPKRTELPISVSKKSVMNYTENGLDNIENAGLDASSDRKNPMIESNIVGSSIKEIQKKANGKYYSEGYEGFKTEKSNENIDTQNVFIKKHTQETAASGVSANEGIKSGEESDTTSKAVRKIHSRNHGKKDAPFEEMEDDVIDKTIQLEELKKHITDTILMELNRRIDEKGDEQDKKIETLRNEITQRMTDELDKKMHEERFDASGKTKRLREEILDQVYDNAKHAVASSDNSGNQSESYTKNRYEIPENVNSKHRKIHSGQYHLHHDTDSPDLGSEDIDGMKTSDITVDNHESRDSDASSHTLRHRYSSKELQMMYEEAIYTMFQNNYDDAVKLFQKILKIRPENRAAQIRLYECLEAIGNA